MKARISFSTDVEKLIEHISGLLSENLDPIENIAELSKCVSNLLKIDKERALPYAIDAIDRIRQSMAEVDESLAETSTLMQGYIRHLAGPEEPEPVQTREPAPVSPPPKGALKWNPETKSTEEYKPTERDDI